MTQPKLLELAKQGEPQAIAILMNRSLQPQGMSVKVTREGDRLSVLLQADQTPNRLVMTNFVRNGITNLKLQSVIQSVDIIGQRTGDPEPAWVQELQLSALDTPGAFLDALDPASDGITAVEGDDGLDLLPSEGTVASGADELSSLLGGNEAESAIENDWFPEEASTTDDLGLAFEDEGMGLSDPSFNGLDLGSSPSDFDFSSSSDLGELDLSADDLDSSSFDLDDDPTGFSTFDLGMDLPPSPEPEDFSLTSDLSSDDFSSDLASDDLTFDSLNGSTASAPDWSLETTSFDSLDESFGESSNSLDFGETNDLDLSDFGDSSTDDLNLSGFSTSDEFGLASDFNTEESTSNDLGLDALGESPAPDWSLDESFGESSTSLDFGETTDLDLSGLGDSPTDELDLSGLGDSPTDELGFSGEFGTNGLAADDLDLDAFSETSSSELDWSLESPNPIDESLDEPSTTLDFGETNDLDLGSFDESPSADLGLSGELGIHELAPDDLGMDAFGETPSSELDWSLESPTVSAESLDESSNSLGLGDLDLSGLGDSPIDDLGFAGEFGAPADLSTNELSADDLGLEAVDESPLPESEANWLLETDAFASLDEPMGNDPTASLDLTNDLDFGGLDASPLDESETPDYEPPSDIIMDRQAFNAGGMPLSADLGLGGFDDSESVESSFYEPPSEIILDDTDDFSLMSSEPLTTDEPSSISDEVAALFDESNTGVEPLSDSDLSGFEDGETFGAFDRVDEFGEISTFDERDTALEPFSTEPSEAEAFGVEADPSLAAEVANLFADDTLDFDTSTFDEAGIDSTLPPEDELGVTADITPGDEEPLFGSANFGQGTFEENPLVELETREENPIPEDFGLSFDAPSPSEEWTSFEDTGIAAETDIPLGDPSLPFGETVPLGELDLSFGEDESDATPLFDVASTGSDWDAAFAGDLTESSADADLVGEDSALESDLDLNLDLQTLDLESGTDVGPSPTEDWATDAAIADLDTPDLLERNGMVADEPYDMGLFGDTLPPELDLSGLELDDRALNDFADTTAADEESQAERFGLTSGDLGTVDSASGVVLDLDAALPDFTDQDTLTFDTGLERDVPPVELELDAQPNPVDAPEAIAAADALAAASAAPPVADMTLVSPEQEIPEDWSSQGTLIDEGELLFDIDENALDNSTFTTSGDLEDEIILTPNVHDEADDWASSPSLATPDPSLAFAATPGAAAIDGPDVIVDEGEPDTLPPDAYGEEHPGAIVPPVPPDEPRTPQPSSSGKRGLFALISLLVGLWLLGILAISLLRRQPDPTPGVATQPTTAPVDPASPDATTTPAPATGNSFQDGLARGASAANLAQTAQSADDWGLVASQWQQAIALFQAVPQSSPDYATAQQKITEYQGYLAVAQQRIASIPAVTETPPTAPALIVADASCQAIETSENSPRLELSNVQLNGTAGSPIQIVGCLTNHTDQPISAVSVVYEQSNTAAPEAVQRTLGRLEVATIRPGETQPFRSDFVLGTDMNQATIQTLQWSVPNERTPQEEEVEVSAALE